MGKLVITFFLLCTGFALINIAYAQDDPWRVDLRTYLLASGMEGKVGALGRTGEVDQSFGDILSNLEFGFMGSAAAHKGPWTVAGDVSYMGLGMENNVVRADVNQWMIEGTLGHKVAHNVDLFGGVRINALRNTFTFKGPLGFETEPHKSWADPIVGVRFTPPLGEKWGLWTQFDIGGFGVGSDFAYQIHALAVRHFNERTALDFGYRVIGMDYESGQGLKKFIYDVTISGPEFGLTLSF